MSLIKKVTLTGFVFFVSCLIFTKTVLSLERPIVGAIRWDAWYGSLDTNVGPWQEIQLSYPEYRYRVPFFGQIQADGKVKLGISQEITDQEIAYAKRAGLDFWAFDVYPERSHLSDALKYYLSSSHKSDINFAMLTANPNSWDTERFVSLIRNEPTYQKVLGNRPLIFIRMVTDETITSWGGRARARALFDDFRSRVQNAGFGNPYIVLMDSQPGMRDKIGADAAGNYAISGACNSSKPPYSVLASSAKAGWNLLKNTETRVVPTVMTGWDFSPIARNPSQWYQNAPTGVYCGKATPQEIARHLSDAIEWVNNNPTAAPARTILIYAWNENTEGGWIVPTKVDDTARIEAVRAILKDIPGSSPTPPPVDKPGDLNDDGSVNDADVTQFKPLFRQNFFKTGSPGFLPIDLNRDGKIDIFDYNVLLTNYGQ